LHVAHEHFFKSRCSRKKGIISQLASGSRGSAYEPAGQARSEDEGSSAYGVAPLTSLGIAAAKIGTERWFALSAFAGIKRGNAAQLSLAS
jgi:hypothetical protein